MEKLNQIIEEMANKKFKDDVGISRNGENNFMFKNATMEEFIRYFTTRKTHGDNTLLYVYGDTKLDSMGGLTEMFIREVLWPKMKDTYFEKVVKELENKVEPAYKVTIEKI